MRRRGTVEGGKRCRWRDKSEKVSLFSPCRGKRITARLDRADRSCIPVRPVFPWQLRVEVQKMFLLE